MKRIMSGMRPTGRLHLGHYFGALTNWLEFQEKYESYFSIVDWHALTTKYQTSQEIKNNIWEIALDWLSVGIDPDKSTLYVQSAIPEIAQLHLLLSMITPQNWVEREPTLKDLVKMLAADEQEAKEKATYGLLGYPVLMTSDILAFRGELVPVGKDQESHLEFARDVARRFNSLYGVSYFPEPQPKFTTTPLLKGLDGQKMGKSASNDIKIADSEEETVKRIRQAITDRTRIAKTDPGHTDLCEVPWPLYLVFAQHIKEQVKLECESAQIGCVDCKARLAGIINEFFRPIRERRKELAKNPDRVRKLLEHGNIKAKMVAQQTLAAVQEIMGLVVWS
ncbi:MAG: tryptophan--tRNA ligase [Candidatus Melainabacteria bacterium]|nr:tryptophan--tRNA ligase [Candidatus Melainabacteria bacterium]